MIEHIVRIKQLRINLLKVAWLHLERMRANMEAGDLNLLQIFNQEQPKIDAVREILREVFEAVEHMHEKN